MTVTPQTYTTNSPWAVADIASMFRTAFIDAGLMTEWYDSFLSGSVENRILEIVYDGSKTYGKTYYWFMFTTTGFYVNIATGWDATTHVPTGTIRRDYFEAATNTVANHSFLLALSNTVTTNLTRYTSGIDSNFTWFILKNGTNEFDFHICKTAPASFIDLDKVMFSLIGGTRMTADTSTASVSFTHFPVYIERMFIGGSVSSTAPAYWTGANSWLSYSPATHVYIFTGNRSAGGTVWPSNPPSSSGSGIYLPNGFSGVNTAYTQDYLPLFTGLPYSMYVANPMPSDFGIASHYINNNMSRYDKFIVSSGSNEWEIIDVANSSAGASWPSTLFLARTV